MSNTIRITKLEHSCIVIEYGNARIAIDPGSFTGERSLEILKGVDAVYVTHCHGDHLSLEVLETIAAPVFAPWEVAGLIDPGKIRATPLDPAHRDSAEVAGFTLRPVTASHGKALSTPVENTGVIVSAGGYRLWVTGDVAGPQPDMVGKFNAVVLPVEGGGFVFTGREAAQFLERAGHRGVAVAVHSDDVPGMRSEFLRAAGGFCKPAAPDLLEVVEISR